MGVIFMLYIIVVYNNLIQYGVQSIIYTKIFVIWMLIIEINLGS